MVKYSYSPALREFLVLPPALRTIHPDFQKHLGEVHALMEPDIGGIMSILLKHPGNRLMESQLKALVHTIIQNSLMSNGAVGVPLFHATKALVGNFLARSAFDLDKKVRGEPSVQFPARRKTESSLPISAVIFAFYRLPRLERNLFHPAVTYLLRAYKKNQTAIVEDFISRLDDSERTSDARRRLSLAGADGLLHVEPVYYFAVGCLLSFP